MKVIRTPLAAVALGFAGALVFAVGAALIISEEPASAELPAAAAIEPAAPVPLDEASFEPTGVTSTTTPTNDARYVAPSQSERLSIQRQRKARDVLGI